MGKTSSIALFLFLLAGSLFGQAIDGNLVGVLYDPSGAALANANLTLENQDTNVKYTTTTNAVGAYRFNNIPAGRYRLTASLAGFNSKTLGDVLVETNRTATQNLTLEVGQVTTSVEVTSAAAAIDTTTANVSTTFNERQARYIPIGGVGAGPTNLGAINLSLLGAGVSSQGGVGYGTGPSIGGQRPTNNNFMIEGVDNNNKSVTGPQVTLSNEATTEFTLQQNQFSPEFGHSTGGQFNVMIKRGDNALHGSAFEYFQNRNLNAVDEAFKRQGILSNPRFDQNRLGGTIGGPAIKNKWFYFFNYEYTPVGQAAAAAGAVLAPTAAGISALDSLSGISRRNLDEFKKWVPVAPTASSTVAVGSANIPVGVVNTIGPAFANNHNYAGSSDFNLSDRDQLRARYAYTRQESLETRVSLPQFFSPVKYSAHLAALSYFHTFSPKVTNELRLGYSRKVDDRPIDSALSWPGLDAFPNINFNDLSLGIGPFGSYPQGNRNNTFNLVDNVIWTMGRHTFKLGYDGRKINSSSVFVQRARGEYTYTTLDRYLRDITPEFGQRSVGGFPFVGNLLSHYAYFNDEIRWRPNFTINLGIRYEYVGVPTGSKQQELNAISNVPGLLEFRAPEATKKDFAPRVGVAWSPGTSGRTSIRGGFGMGYDQIYQNLGGNSLPPQFFTTIDAHLDRPDQPNFLGSGGITGEPRPITSASRARQLTTSFVPLEQIRPYSLQWNLGVQHVMWEDYTVEVRYLGSRGVHLPFQVQMNRPASVVDPARSLPTYLQRPSQAELNALPLSLANFPTPSAATDRLVAAGFVNTITTFLPVGNSSYHGLATQLTKRFSRGVQLLGAYTWSHNIDDSTAALFSTVTTPRRPQDFNNLAPERADSALDHRHRFTFSWVYEVPWFKGSSSYLMKNIVGNWHFAGTYTVESGTWATLRSGVDSNRNGDNAGDRVIYNPAGNPLRGSAVTPLTNAAGQTVAYLATDPTAGYIVAGPGVYPTLGRNTIQLPRINNFDLGAGKRVNITERAAVEFRAEFYNAFNHPQYIPGYPSAANLRNRTGTSETGMLIPGNSLFLRPDLAFQSNARGGQLVLRVVF
jgi:hypothetical protein